LSARFRLASADAPMTIERRSAIEPLAPEWNELADRTAAMPWVRPGWIAAWRRAFGHGALQLLTVRQGGRLCGVLPLERRFGELRSPTNPQTPGFCLLAEGSAIRRTLANLLLCQQPRGIDLRYLPIPEGGFEESYAAARAAGYRIISKPITRSPFVRSDGDWMAYERQLGSKKLRELRRRRRLLERSGQLSLEVHDGSDRLETLLEEGFRVETSGWKEERRTAISSQGAMCAFYSEIAGWAAARGWLRLAFLKLDGRALAFDYCLEEGGRHYLLKTGYDPAYRMYGPGMLLRYEMLARAFRLGVRTYEFLGSDDAWKLEWTNEAREMTLLHAFAPSIAGLTDWVMWSYGRPAGRRVLRRGPR
jgi:CelD/BcsL family acetyltransferase involved in cellulose biosynthesis